MTMIPTPNQQKQFQSTEYQTILYILPEYSTNLQQIKKTIHGDTELKKKEAVMQVYDDGKNCFWC